MADAEDRIPPIALPAGSFELSELQEALDKAVSVQDREKHPERINKAIAETIKNPELLAAADAPAIPAGASLTKQPIVYAEGQKPIERDAIAFDPVKAKDGTDASNMRYDQRGEKTVATDAPAGIMPETKDVPETLAEQAAARVEEETDTASSRAGARSK